MSPLPQAREDHLVARENSLAAAQEAVAAQQGAAQVEVSRLEAAVRELNKQLGEAEADYLTGSERLAQLHREVSEPVHKPRRDMCTSHGLGHVLCQATRAATCTACVPVHTSGCACMFACALTYTHTDQCLQ